MTRRLRRIAPAPAGMTLAALYGCAGLLGAPLFYLLTSVVPAAARPLPGLGLTLLVAMPLFYAIIGFVLGYFGSLLYNWIARFTGGIQFDVEAVGEAV